MINGKGSLIQTNETNGHISVSLTVASTIPPNYRASCAAGNFEGQFAVFYKIAVVKALTSNLQRNSTLARCKINKYIF